MTYNVNKFWRLTTTSAIALISAAVLGGTAHSQAPNLPAVSWSHSSETEVDRDLAEADIQIKYDGLDVVTQLNVTANNGAVTVQRGSPVAFSTFSNYDNFIERGEIRIFGIGASVQSTPLMVLPVGADRQATLVDMNALPDDIIYVLRVYGAKERFDETEAKPLTLTSGENLSPVETIHVSNQIGHSIDRTSIRNIRVKGASVTVFGENIVENNRVTVSGQSVPTDLDGRFIKQMILPFGDHAIEIEVQNETHRKNFTREVYLDDTDFFYVSIGDITLGTSSSVAPAEFLGKQDQDFNDVSTIGRGSF